MAKKSGALAVLVTDWQQAAWATRFRVLDPERNVLEWPDIPDPADVAYAAVWKPQLGALEKFHNLEAIFNLGAGVDHLLGDPTLPDAPIVRVVDDSLTAPMSEYVVLHVLMHFRQQLRYSEFQARSEWKPLAQPFAHEISVGILGLGTLGRDAAQKLTGLGFDVAGWSRSPQTLEGVESFAGSEQLDAFLGRTDILVSLLPATPETAGLVDRSFLAKLRQDGALGAPVYINAGRGATQVEDDLVEALNARELAGVSLDVFETEPLSPDSALWRHPRAIITPHMAADTSLDAVSAYVMSGIRDLEAGAALKHVVDRSRGY